MKAQSQLAHCTHYQSATRHRPDYTKPLCRLHHHYSCTHAALVTTYKYALICSTVTSLTCGQSTLLVHTIYHLPSLHLLCTAPSPIWDWCLHVSRPVYGGCRSECDLLLQCIWCPCPNHLLAKGWGRVQLLLWQPCGPSLWGDHPGGLHGTCVPDHEDADIHQRDGQRHKEHTRRHIPVCGRQHCGGQWQCGRVWRCRELHFICSRLVLAVIGD